MFRGLSESKDFPRGKKMNHLSRSQRHQQFDLGIPEWQQSYFTATQILHNEKPLGERKANHEGRNQSHFNFQSDNLKDAKCYLSEKADKFRNNFNRREENKKINKKEILKTTFVLGEDVGNYSTQHQMNFYDKSKIKLPEIQWKAQRERYDILTNNEVKKERLEKACGFDFWNENKDKKRISRNYTQIPKDNEVFDVIMGRMRKIL